MVLDERLIYEILSVVAEIPRGRVATYGQIARLIGRDRNARLVGKVLSWRKSTETIRVTGWSIMRGGLPRFSMSRKRGSGKRALRFFQTGMST